MYRQPCRRAASARGRGKLITSQPTGWSKPESHCRTKTPSPETLEVVRHSRWSSYCSRLSREQPPPSPSLFSSASSASRRGTEVRTLTTQSPDRPPIKDIIISMEKLQLDSTRSQNGAIQVGCTIIPSYGCKAAFLNSRSGRRSSRGILSVWKAMPNKIKPSAIRSGSRR